MDSKRTLKKPRTRTSQAKTHKDVIITLTVTIPKGVRLAELEARKNWDTVRISTKKFNPLVPVIYGIKTKFVGLSNEINPTVLD